MRYFITFLFLTVVLILPVLAETEDSIVVYKPALNKFLIIDMSNAASPREKAETLHTDGTITANPKRDAWSFLLEPVALKDDYYLSLSALKSGNVGQYLLIGTSVNYHLSANTGFKLGGSLGYEFTSKTVAFGASLLFITNWQEYKGLTTELDFKSSGDLLWYCARVSVQIIPAISVGLRSQKNSLTGPYIHLGNEDWVFMWISYGVGDDFKSPGLAVGIRITSTMLE